jgi:hypothetical protein
MGRDSRCVVARVIIHDDELINNSVSRENRLNDQADCLSISLRWNYDGDRSSSG